MGSSLRLKTSFELNPVTKGKQGTFPFSFRCSQKGAKYEKAVEWRLPIATVQWLNDLLLGNLDALKAPLDPRYQIFGGEDDFRIEPWRVTHLMGRCT